MLIQYFQSKKVKLNHIVRNNFEDTPTRTYQVNDFYFPDTDLVHTNTTVCGFVDGAVRIRIGDIEMYFPEKISCYNPCVF
jgi:hypothetical protein